VFPLLASSVVVLSREELIFIKKKMAASVTELNILKVLSSPECHSQRKYQEK
jgi:hypothetical protein